MSSRRACWQASVAITAVAAVVATCSGAALAQPHVTRLAAHHVAGTNKQRITKLLHPRKKYYGVYVSQAPSRMAPLRKVTQETGKQPNLSLYYQAWGSGARAGVPNFNTAGAEHACHAGMLPMMTWESWSTTDVGRHGVAVTQPKFAPRRIARGRYDRYIRATARKIKALGCPIALRLDQEVNSNWYPWAVNTPGMHNTAHAYVAMWRHVWRVFKSVHADNVIWVWTPNVQSRKHKGLPSLRKSYPGAKYVNWVGVDGYFYNRPHETFHQLFGSTAAQLEHFAAHKPWIIAECGVGSGPSKAKQIADLLRAVAHSKRFDGINYFDTDKAWNRSDWAFDQTSASLRAFKTGINRSAFGAGKPGTVPGT